LVSHPLRPEARRSGCRGCRTGRGRHVDGGRRIRVSEFTADTENADIDRERLELATQPELEREELAQIYVERGVSPDIACQVADQLMAKDALGAHAHDELGISAMTTARPIQAALISAATFSVGAAMPLAMVLEAPADSLVWAVSAASLLFLALLGAIDAKAGAAPTSSPRRFVSPSGGPWPWR